MDWGVDVSVHFHVGLGVIQMKVVMVVGRQLDRRPTAMRVIVSVRPQRGFRNLMADES